MNTTPNTVLDGGTHAGLTVEVSAHLSEIVIDGYRYIDTGHLHRSEPHGWLRWFRADIDRLHAARDSDV